MESELFRTEEGVSQWRALHVIHNHEKKIALHMVNRSIEHFLPLYTERSRWSDRSVTLERPLFPGYIFVRFARESRHSIIGCAGVLRILGKGDGEVVADAEIDRIRRAISDGLILRPHAPICAGIRVRVINGVFVGTEGVVTELRSNCRVVVSMAAVRQCYSLETHIWNLEILDKKVVQAEKEYALIVRSKLR